MTMDQILADVFSNSWVEKSRLEEVRVVGAPVAKALIRAAYAAGQLACENHDYKRGYEAGKRDAGANLHRNSYGRSVCQQCGGNPE